MCAETEMRSGLWVGEKEDVVDGGTSLKRVAGTRKGVDGEEMLEQGAGAEGGSLGERERAGGGSDGCVGVVGEVEGDVFVA